MTEQEEKNFMDYLPVVIAVLFAMIAIYLIISGDDSPSPNFTPMGLFGTPEYNIASAFDIVK